MSTLTRPNYPLDYLLSCRDMINNYRYPFGPKFVNRASLGRLITNFSWVYNHCFNLRIFHINSHRWGEQSIEKYFNFIFEEVHQIKYLIYIPSEGSITVSWSRGIYIILFWTNNGVRGKIILNFPSPTQYFKIGFSFLKHTYC